MNIGIFWDGGGNVLPEYTVYNTSQMTAIFNMKSYVGSDVYTAVTMKEWGTR
jgi:hypothetical protein